MISCKHSNLLKIADSCRKESEVLSLPKGDYQNFSPKLVDSGEFDGFSVIVMDNLQRRCAANELTGINDPVDHLMYTLALFHTEVTKAVFNSDLNIQSYPYRTLTGESHLAALEIPLGGKDWSVKDLRSDGVRKIIREGGGIITDVEDYMKSNDQTIIHGDPKKENIVNGYLVDFGMVSRGSPVWDVAYALTDWNISQHPQLKLKYVDRYIQYRKELDPDFASTYNSSKEIQDMYHKTEFAANVLRTSVLRKRTFNKFYQRRREEGEFRILNSLGEVIKK